MRIALATLIALAAAPAAATERPAPDPATKTGAVCPNADIHRVGRDKPLGAHPLTQEPGARQEIAVLHTENGCVKPIVVGEDIGGPSRSR
ncbi:MAG TPA: hypothetical protein VM657_14665 [Sphingomonas sp.]|nr:hypothetical protein [Sphingomonas sp.]